MAKVKLELVKSFLKSKTFWGAVLVVISGISVSLGYVEVAATVGSVGAALGLVGVRTAEGKLIWK